MTANDAAGIRKWYAIYTRPRAEKQLDKQLKAKRILTYLPLVRLRRKWSDRYKWVERPLFESYIFAQIQYETEALEILRSPHAIHFVTSAGAPATISDNDIEMLKIAVASFAESMTINDTTEFIPGEKVLIKFGPFAGKEGVIERLQGKTLLLISFPGLNKTLQVELPVNQVQSGSEALFQ